MKKITFLTIITLSILFGLNANAQPLQSENYDGLLTGDVGTDITGVVAGQGGLFTLTNSGTNADFQIVDTGGSLGFALEITGSDSPTGSKYVWEDGLGTAWSSRTSGNDIIQVEYNFFTGPTTTSKNIAHVQLYNSDYSILIAGFSFNQETKVISGLAYYDNGGTLDTFAFYLGAGNTDLILTENTWYRVGFAFNVTTGNVTWRGFDFYGGVPGAAAGIAPFEVDYAINPGTGNAVSSVSYYDDMKIKAVATENLLLSINDNDLSQSIKIFPNPVNDVINLSIPNHITATKIEIADINGRIVKSISYKGIRNQINVSELSSGLYLLNIYSLNGKASKKFLKN